METTIELRNSLKTFRSNANIVHLATEYAEILKSIGCRNISTAPTPKPHDGGYEITFCDKYGDEYSTIIHPVRYGADHTTNIFVKGKLVVLGEIESFYGDYEPTTDVDDWNNAFLASMKSSVKRYCKMTSTQKLLTSNF